MQWQKTRDTLILHHQLVHDCLDMFSWLGRSSLDSEDHQFIPTFSRCGQPHRNPQASLASHQCLDPPKTRSTSINWDFVNVLLHTKKWWVWKRMRYCMCNCYCKMRMLATLSSLVFAHTCALESVVLCNSYIVIYRCCPNFLGPKLMRAFCQFHRHLVRLEESNG